MKKILIVEDEPSLQQAYIKTLDQEYELAVAASADEVKTKLAESIPDLIILDIMLPGGKNGFDILNDLKGDIRTKEIPVIMLTNLDESQEQTALECGASEYVEKTVVGPEEIEELVKKYIGGK